MSRLRLLADDLTGALDSAVTFCGARGAIPVLLRAQGDVGDAALDLACRDGSEAAAVAATLAAMPFLAGADLAYLKIDSLLRGHWAAMLGALWRTGAFGSCILAPAFLHKGGLRAPVGTSRAICMTWRGPLPSTSRGRWPLMG